MKLIFKILSVPIILVIDLFTLVCTGLIFFSAFFLRPVSGIVGILGIFVLVTYSVKNGLILLTIPGQSYGHPYDSSASSGGSAAHFLCYQKLMSKIRCKPKAPDFLILPRLQQK